MPARDASSNLDLLPQSESVFALSNGHIGWRGNLDEGEPHGLPGTYLNGVHELHPLPYAEARLRLPGVRPDGHQRHQRQAACGCWSTTSRSTCATARLRSHERELDLRAGVLRADLRVVLAGRARGPGALDPAGLVHPAGGRRGRVRGGAGRRPRSGWWCSRSWSPTRSCRAPRGDPRAAGGPASRRWRPRSTSPSATGCGWCTAPAQRAAGRGRPPTTGSTGPRADHARSVGESTADARAGSPSPRCWSPGERLRLEKFVAYGWSGDPLAAGAARPGRTRRSPARRAHRLGRPARRAAGVPGRLLGARGRRGGRRRRDPAGRAVRALPRAAGRRARRAAGDPRQGPDRLRLRRARLLGHRDASCCRC